MNFKNIALCLCLLHFLLLVFWARMMAKPQIYFHYKAIWVSFFFLFVYIFIIVLLQLLLEWGKMESLPFRKGFSTEDECDTNTQSGNCCVVVQSFWFYLLPFWLVLCWSTAFSKPRLWIKTKIFLLLFFVWERKEKIFVMPCWHPFIDGTPSKQVLMKYSSENSFTQQFLA